MSDLRDSLSAIDDLGPFRPHTPTQEAIMRRLCADQPDRDQLLAAMGVRAGGEW